MTRTLLPLALLALTAAGSAQAQGFGAGRAMGKIDTNGDGLISASEVESVNAMRFQRLDANGNGALTPEEFSAPAMQAFAAIDANGDGALSRSEMRAKADAARGLFGMAR